MFEEDVELFNKIMAEHYLPYQRKMKQWCFSNGTTYDDDVLSETYVKCADRISRVGIEDKTEQGILNYFFIAFKRNTYQHHLQKQKDMVDSNADVFSLLLEDTPPEEIEQAAQHQELLVKNILDEIRENFDEIDYHIFRLRYLFQVDGKFLNYKQIKAMTNIPDTRKRLMRMNAYIRSKFPEKNKITKQNKK